MEVTMKKLLLSSFMLLSANAIFAPVGQRVIATPATATPRATAATLATDVPIPAIYTQMLADVEAKRKESHSSVDKEIDVYVATVNKLEKLLSIPANCKDNDDWKLESLAITKRLLDDIEESIKAVEGTIAIRKWNTSQLNRLFDVRDKANTVSLRLANSESWYGNGWSLWFNKHTRKNNLTRLRKIAAFSGIALGLLGVTKTDHSVKSGTAILAGLGLALLDK